MTHGAWDTVTTEIRDKGYKMTNVIVGRSLDVVVPFRRARDLDKVLSKTCELLNADHAISTRTSLWECPIGKDVFPFFVLIVDREIKT